MEKQYRIEYQDGGEWLRSIAAPSIYTEAEASAILTRFAGTGLAYRMVYGYAPPTVDLHDETPISSVWVLYTDPGNYGDVGPRGDGVIVGVFTSLDKARIYLGQRTLARSNLYPDAGEDALDTLVRVQKFDLDKGKEG